MKLSPAEPSLRLNQPPLRQIVAPWLMTFFLLVGVLFVVPFTGCPSSLVEEKVTDASPTDSAESDTAAVDTPGADAKSEPTTPEPQAEPRAEPAPEPQVEPLAEPVTELVPDAVGAGSEPVNDTPDSVTTEPGPEPQPTLQAPANVATADIVLWLKSDAGVSVTSGAVMDWADQSGNNNHASAVATSAPTYVPTSADANNAPIVSFRTNAQHMMTVANPANFNIATPSIFVVFKKGPAGDKGALISKGFGTSSFFNDWRKLEAYTDHWRSGADVNFVTYTAPAGRFNVATLISRSNRDHSIGVNGTITTSTQSLYHTSYNTASFKLGALEAGFEHVEADIAEVIVYKRALSDSERKQVECYLAGKYRMLVESCYKPPTSVAPTNLVLWLSSDNGITESAGKVTAWADQSGRNNHASAVATTAPALVSASTAGANNYPTLAFRTAGLTMMTVANPANFNIATPSIFVVFKKGPAGDKGALISKGFGTSSTSTSWRKLEAYPTQWRSGVDTDFITYTAPAGRFNVITLISRSNRDHSIGVNGATTTSTKTLHHTSYNTASFKLGTLKAGFEHVEADIAEVIVYKTALSAAEQTLIECYLSIKYRITVAGCP